MEADATKLLLYMGDYPADKADQEVGSLHFSGSELAEATGIEPNRLNDAVELLD
jgi:hypothetical protein